jgi:hypothetical protein
MVNTMALDRSQDSGYYYDARTDTWEQRRRRSAAQQMLDWKVDRVLENEARKMFKRERDGNKQS